MNNKIRQAMVLAAGRGERLRPLTDQCPKPLLKVKNKPLLIHHLERLSHAGFERIVINLGWLGEQIPPLVAEYQTTKNLASVEIIFSQEPQGALETAGGIRHALHHFDQQPFALISADVLTDLDYSALSTQTLKHLAHLFLVANPPHHPEGDFRLGHDGVLLPKEANTKNPALTYSGLGVFDPTLFAPLAPGHRPLRPVLDQAINHQQVTGHSLTGHWLDIGTTERLDEAESATWLV